MEEERFPYHFLAYYLKRLFIYLLILLLLLFFNFFSFIFISWRLITLQYCSHFYHTFTWISHGFTCIPHPDPPSHLPLSPIPLGLPSAPGPSTCLMHPTWLVKQPRCPSADKWIRKMWYIYTMEYYSAIKKNSFKDTF